MTCFMKRKQGGLLDAEVQGEGVRGEPESCQRTAVGGAPAANLSSDGDLCHPGQESRELTMGRGRSDANHATRDCPSGEGARQGGRWDDKIVKHHTSCARKRASGSVARVPGSRGERGSE